MRILWGFHVSDRTILRKKRQANVQDNTNITLSESSQLLQATYITYKVVIKDGQERRNTFINDLASVKVKAGKIRVVNALK